MLIADCELFRSLHDAALSSKGAVFSCTLPRISAWIIKVVATHLNAEDAEQIRAAVKDLIPVGFVQYSDTQRARIKEALS